MPHGKRYLAAKKLIDSKKLYPMAEALELVKKTSGTKFDATVELHVHLGIDVAKGDQQIRATVVLPHSIGKEKKIAAFVSPDKETDARDAGASVVGGEDLIAEIAKTGAFSFDVAVASPDMMPKLAKIAKILGPVGLMPNPKTETVGANVRKMIEDLKRGKVAFKNDTTANVHQSVGKVSMSNEQLSENLTTFMDAVRKAKPSSSKGVFIQSVTLASAMGPGIHLDTSLFA